MTNNCLVTKLKSVVNNPNLDKLGILKLWAGPAQISYNILGAISSNKSILTSIDNVTLYTSGSTIINETQRYAIANNTSSSFSNTPIDSTKIMTFELSEKYNINVLKGFKLKSLRDIIDMPLVEFNMYGPYTYEHTYMLTELSEIFDKSLLKLFVITGYSAKWSCVKGNISVLNDFQNLEDIRLHYASVNGDISNINSLTKLNTLGFDSTSISGSLDSLVSIFAQSKANDDTLNVTGNGIVTYKSNGDGTGDDVIIPNNTTKVVTFNGQGGYTIA